MIDFFDITNIDIPEGKIIQIKSGDRVIWSKERVTVTLSPWVCDAVAWESILSKSSVKYTINGKEYEAPSKKGEALVLTVPIGTIIKCDMVNYKSNFGEYGSCHVLVNGVKQTTDDGFTTVKETATCSLKVTEDMKIYPKTENVGTYLDQSYDLTLNVEANGFLLGLNLPILDCVYISLGDSIAAGHSLDYYNSGEKTQVGYNSRTYSTAIHSKSYTGRIRDDLLAVYGDKLGALSFARSGDRVVNLMSKLDNTNIINSIKYADLVTICIGANDILVPAMESFDDYVVKGQQVLNELSSGTIATNLSNLGADSYTNSYRKLFEKLDAIEREKTNTRFIFTTVYNPYKYLYLEPGTNGFFKPLLDVIPDFNILGFSIGELIREGLLNTSAVTTLFERTNAISAWAETHINELNNVLRTKINEYKAVNPNFYLAETKALFDTYPDRTPNIANDTEYNDLVNVEFTRNYTVSEADWGALRGSKSWYEFWLDLATDYITFSGFDINGFAEDLVAQVIDKVILPDTDPHPESNGHKVLRDAFIEHIDLE